MANVRALNKDKYRLSDYRFRELYYFCLQYHEWKQKLNDKRDPLKGMQYSGSPSSGISSPTEVRAIECAELSNKCMMIEEAARSADPELYQYILFAVTHPNIRYEFEPGNYGVFKLDEAGIMNQFQYKDELFGESNACLYPTMELINTNNQGIIEGVKSSATLRFLAKIAQTLKPADLETERKRFVESNFSASNAGGVMLIDAKYDDVKQLQTNQYTVDSAQMEQIKENVFNYFGTNDKILQNKFSSEEWNAYYEGKIEPFAIEASLVHTNMTFTPHEIAFGNEIIFTANRLQYASNDEKLNIVTQLFDRGFLTHNQGLEIFNMKTLGEDGDQRYIRKEYGKAEYETDPGEAYVKYDSVEAKEGNENADNEG